MQHIINESQLQLANAKERNVVKKKIMQIFLVFIQVIYCLVKEKLICHFCLTIIASLFFKIFCFCIILCYILEIN